MSKKKQSWRILRVKRYDPMLVTLIYQCPKCPAKYHQRADEIVEAGTAICPDCDCDCVLEMVEVKG